MEVITVKSLRGAKVGEVKFDGRKLSYRTFHKADPTLRDILKDAVVLARQNGTGRIVARPATPRSPHRRGLKNIALEDPRFMRAFATNLGRRSFEAEYSSITV